MSAPPALEGPRPIALRWRVAVFVAGYVGIHVVVGGLVGVVVGLLFLLTNRATLSTLATVTDDPTTLMLMQAGGALPLLVGYVGLCVIMRRYFDRRSVRSMGLGRPRQGWPITLAGGALAGGVPLALAVGLLTLVGAFSSWAVQTSWLTWLAVPTLVVMAFNEEITCRGYLLQTFLDEGRPTSGILVSSSVFWLLHVLNPSVWSTPLASINLFGAGIVLALAYLASGNVWFPTVMHFAWNAVQGIVFELPVSGMSTDGVINLERTGAVADWLTGGAFGLEGSVLITAAELFLGVGLWLWWRRAQPHTQSG